MTGCARREEVFLEEMDSDEENSNRKAGEESTAYENNVAAGENPEKQSVVSDAGSEGNTENSALDLPPETPIPQKIFVDVCGAVVNPGVYELDEGARIFQAVDAAGGYLPEAAINYLNRARSIGDGQQIYVPTEKEVAENLELAMAKVPEALNDGDNSGNLGLEEIQGSSVENPSGTVGRDTGSFIGDSYRELTRIANINEDLWSELFLGNKDHLLNAINRFELELDLIKKSIYDNDAETLKQYFIKSTKRREKLDQ